MQRKTSQLQAQDGYSSLGNVTGIDNFWPISASLPSQNPLYFDFSEGQDAALVRNVPAMSQCFQCWMMLAVLLLHVLQILPLGWVVHVCHSSGPWLCCWHWLNFVFLLFFHAVVTAARITTMSLTRSCIRSKFWQSFWSLQPLKILSVMWECKFFLCVNKGVSL